MSGRARVGARIGGGAIRVDPRKAIEKLREFQLADPASWALEVVRAAVGFGATAVEVRGDSDEVWIAWSGPRPEPKDLVSLLGQLVSPQHGREGRARRLLAIGVNAALGTRPKMVDVYVREDEGLARYRYRPGLLDGSRGDAPLEPERERVEDRPDVPAQGLAVHVVRPFGFAALGVFFRGGEPPEVRVARGACAYAPCPVAIGGEPPAVRPAPLARAPLGDGLEGFVEIVDPGEVEGLTGAVLDAAELGVVMARLSFVPAGFRDGARGIPVRLYLSAERLPSNASRSDLRRDESPLPEAIARANELLPGLVAALAEELGAAEGDRRARLRRAALGLLAAAIGGADFVANAASKDAPACLAPLLAVPLVQDAHGRPRALRDLDASSGARVHVGREPLGHELEPWVGGVPWIPRGDDAEVLLAGATPAPLAPVIATATAALGARKAFFEHRPSGDRIPADRTQWLSVRIEAPAIGLAGALEDAAGDARGEVVLLDPLARRPGLFVQMLHEGRPIHRVELPASLPIDAVVESRAVAPRPDYRGVVEDAAYRGAIREVVRAALSALEVLADPAAGEHEMRPGFPSGDAERMRAKRDEAVRAAVGSALTLFAGRVTRGNPERKARDAMRSAESRLGRAPVWTALVDGAPRTVSLADIAREAIDPVLAVPPDVPPASLPTGGYWSVRASSGDAVSLARALEGVRVVQAHDPTRGVGDAIAVDRMLSALGGPGRAALAVRAEGHRAVVAWGEAKPTLTLYHRGVRLEARPFDGSLGRASIAIDHDGIVPAPAWDSVRAGPRPEPDLRGLAARLATAFAEWLLGRPRPDLRILRGTDDAGLRRDLVLALAAGAAIPDDVRAGLWALPLVDRLRPHPPASLDDLAARRAEPLAFVTPEEARIDFDPGEFDPVVADRAHAAALAALTGRQHAHAGKRLPELARLGRRAAKRAAHLRKPPPAAVAEALVLAVELGAPEAPRFLGLRTRDSGLDVDVRIEGRSLVRVTDPKGPPVAGFVTVPDEAADADYADLTVAGRARVESAIDEGVRGLLSAMAEGAPDLPSTSACARALVARFVDAHGGDADADPLADVLRERLRFPGLHGPHVTVAEACRGGALAVCRFPAKWIGPGEGEAPSRLDGAVVLLPDGAAGDTLLPVLESLASPRPVDDATTEARALQSRRRVAQGLVPAPRTGAPDPRLAAPVEALAGKSRALAELGVGELALVPDGGSEVRLFELGEPVAILPLEMSPAVIVALESPRLAGALDAGKKLPRDALRKLQKNVAALRANLARKLLEDPPGDLAPWARASLRSLALADEGLADARFRDARIFDATDGRVLSLGDLRAEAKRRSPLWAVPEPESTARALDAERPVLRLALAEIAALAKRVEVIDAREALAREAAERAFLARPEVDVHAPPTGHAVLGAVRWEGGGASRKGVCIALAPASASARGLEIVHAGRLLGRVADPAEWPCLARVEDPAIAPDDRFEGPRAGPELEKLKKAVRAAAESALASMVAVREDTLAAVAVDRKLGSAEAGVTVRGAVHLDDSVTGGGLELEHPGGRTALVLDAAGPPGKVRYALPLRGRLVATGDPGDPTMLARIQEVARGAYGRMIRELARGLAGPHGGDDAALAHVVRAAAIRVLRPRDASFGDVAVPCFHPQPWTLAEVNRFLEGDARIFAARPTAIADAPGGVPVLLDDGSRASRALLEHLGSRVERPSARLFGVVARVTSTPPIEEAPNARKKRGARAKPKPNPAKGRSKSAQAPAAPPPEASHPLDPIATALLVLLRRIGLGGPHLAAIVVRADVASPTIAYDEGRKRLELAGKSPVLAGLAQLADRRDARAEAALALLAARAAGIMNRALAPVTDANEASALAALLAELAEP